MGSSAEWLNAIATCLAALVAFLGWRVQQSISRREARRIVLDVYERFFARDECRKIIRAIEKDFEEELHRKFWKRLCEKPSRDESSKASPDELDEIDLDEYLGYFELLGSLLRRKAIYFEDVYDLFGYYIENAWKHKHIQQDHIERLRADNHSPDIYEQFQYLAGLVIAYSEKRKLREVGNLARSGVTKEPTSMKEMVKKVLACFHRCFHLQAMVTGAMAGVGFWGIFWEIRRVDLNWRYATICAAFAGAGLAGLLAIFFSAYWSQKERKIGLAMEIADKNKTPPELEKTTENRHVTDP